ncbi:MAG TPA: hypothetical protein VM487_10060 [Phycisphaerae bacterium]|nr:hypothetical protein [Phycisphaerae bacterium]
MSTSPAVGPIPRSDAHRWFDHHLPELIRRARLFARRLPRGERDEAVAEILAMMFRYVFSAAVRGKLRVLTAPALVRFYCWAYLDGRRAAGASGRDVFSPRVHRRHGVSVVSLDQPRRIRTRDGETVLSLSEVLADRRSDRPPEHCRKNVDYEEILQRQKASRKARAVFDLLAETHGAARGVDMARQLRVSTPRIVQLKYELADCLAAEGYGPPAVWMRRRSRRGRGRPRRPDPPLNVGTSPPSR